MARARPIATTACVRTRAATFDTMTAMTMKKKKAATLVGSAVSVALAGIQFEVLHEKYGGERDTEFFVRLMHDLGVFRRANAADKAQRGVLVAEKRGRQTGRPAKLTQRQLADAVAALQAGEPIAVVAKNAGVSVPTLYRYRAAYRR